MNTNQLRNYLAAAAGAGCIVQSAESAVTFYGIDSANDTNPDPPGIDIGFSGAFLTYDADLTNSSTDSRFAFNSGIGIFSDGTVNTGGPADNVRGTYANSGGFFLNGAQSGDQNYANVTFDGNDGVFEAVAQFHFDGAGGGYLIAVATNDAPNEADALSIIDGKALIDAAAIPEPSSLGLLALGATGLMVRRRRR